MLTNTVRCVISKALSLVLLMMVAWVGLASLVIGGALGSPTHLAPCHQSTPSSPSPQPDNSDHACCAVGHDQALLSGKLVMPPLQVARLIESAMVPPVRISWDFRESRLSDSYPQDTTSPPIRI